MEAKYSKAMQAGLSVGLAILCVVAVINTSQIQCLTCMAWAAIVLLLLATGALSVRMTTVTALNDVLMVSVVAGVVAAIVNAVGLIAYNIFLSVMYGSVDAFVQSIICWTPLAFILGIILPTVGGVIWHFVSARGLVK